MTGKRKPKIEVPVSTESPPVYLKAREDDFVAKGHLTKHLTGNQYDVIRERTRINSWEELDYISWKELLAHDLNVALYHSTCGIHLGLKISKDGEGRKEDVEAIFGLQDDFGEGRKPLGLRRLGEVVTEKRGLLHRNKGTPNE